MSARDNHFNRVGGCGRVWADPRKPKRKRFLAWFEKGMDIRVKYFPTRKAAVIWLRFTEMKAWKP